MTKPRKPRKTYRPKTYEVADPMMLELRLAVLEAGLDDEEAIAKAQLLGIHPAIYLRTIIATDEEIDRHFPS